LRSSRDAVVLLLGASVRVGARALLRMGGVELRGRVIRLWGRGKAIVRFRRGLPGQALGREVEIVD